MTFQYAGRKVISSFSYTFEPDIIYGIKAPSGTGKTTLLNLINGSLKPTNGMIDLKDQNLSNVFQEPELLSHLTILQNVSLPLASVYNKSTSEAKAMEMLQLVEMDMQAERYPNELSYGQQQRVALARALAFPSTIMLLDEPFKGLDKTLTFRIIGRILSRQATTRQIIIFTSHNPEELTLLASVIIQLPEIN